MSIVSGFINAEQNVNGVTEFTVQDTMFASALSDCSGKPDFKYVFDVYTNGNQLTRVKLYPDPITAYGYFDAGPSVRNEMTYEWFIASANDSGYKSVAIGEPNDSGQIAINYDIRFGEEYISGGAYVSGTYVSGGTLVTLLNEVSGTKKAYNYAAPLFNRKSYAISQFNNKFLTNRPKKAYCRLDGNLIIPFKVPENSSVSFGFKIVQYNQSNTSYRTFNQYTDYNTTYYNMTEFHQLNIGPVSLNQLLTTAAKPNIIDSTKYYDVNLVNMDTGAIIGESFRVYLDCNPKYDNIDLFFMNQWGMFDTARFDLSSRLTMDIERKSFNRKDYYTENYGVYYSTRKETKINYGSKLNWTYKLTMNYPTDEEYVWLSELISSPQIYANFPEITDGCIMPVTIKNTNYEYSTNQNNGLKVLEIEVEMNQTRYGFLR
jgi:hypothetical protein